MRFEREFGKQGATGLELVGIALKAQLDSQVAGAQCDRIRAAAGDDGGAHAALLQHFQSLSIAHVKRLDFRAGIAVVERAVSQHSVHVEDGETHLLRFPVDVLHH